MTTTKNNEHKKLNFSNEREQNQACLNSAEHEKNQGRKVLNVPNKQEQNQTCLDSAEREGLRPKGNVPNLRFPEFQGEWEESTIGEEFDLYSGNTPSRLNKEHFNGAINWISSGELKEHYIADTKEKISDEAAKTLKMLPIGTFVIAIYGLEADGVRGTGSITKTEATISQACMAFISKGKVQNEFLYSWYKKHGNVIGIRYAQGTKQQNLSYDIIEKLKIAYPTFQEQEKLNKFIALLDERIATQNKIIDKLQSLIKGLRVRLIQIENGNIVHLGEIARIYQPQTISSTELTEDGFLVYGANGIIGKYKEYNHKTEQICITCRGNTCGMVNYTKPMSWITGNAMVINTDEHQNKVCKRYLYHYLSAYNFNSIISGSGQPQIVRTPLENLEITLPSIFEQEQKAMLLDRIQAKIEISNRVLSLCQEQKQYLLRQMFI